MKKLIYLVVAWICLALPFAHAQSVRGALTIGKSSDQKIEVKSDNLVDLFIDFRKERFPILFSFQGDGIKSKEGREIIFFEFITEVYHNGKLLGKNSRNPMPYIPGDMIIGTEGFDFISLLSYNELTRGYTKESPGKMAPGSYQVKLSARALNAKGSLKPATFSFTVK